MRKITETLAYVDHREATDPQQFLDAADLIDAGVSIESAYETLSPQHKTTLFHVEKLPPLPMLARLGKKEAPALLRSVAASMKDEA